MRVAVILNPAAAGGRAARLRGAIAGRFAGMGVEARFLESAGPGDARRLAAEQSLADDDAVVAAGGDGTVFEVVNGLLERPAGERVPLGVVPVGTGNAFAREFGLGPGDWRRAIDLVAAGRTGPIDVGRVLAGAARYHFVNVVGVGFAADAGRTAARLKFVGNAAYTLAAVWHLLRLRSHAVRLEVDGETLEEDAIVLEIANSRYTGTRFLIAPEARLDDGLLDVVLVRRMPRRRIARLFPTIYRGEHVAHEEVLVRRGRRVRLLGPPGVPLAPDGEQLGVSPAEFECLPGALEAFRP